MFECFDLLAWDANAVDSVLPSDARSSLQLHTGYIWPGFKLFPAEVLDAMNIWKLFPQSLSYLPHPPLPHRP